MNHIIVVTIAAALVIPGAACSDKKPTNQAKVELHTVSDASLGYSIEIPKGSKTLRKSEYGHTFSFPLPGGMHEYNIALAPIDAKNLDDFVQTATMVDKAAIEIKKPLEGGGFMLVKAPRGSIQEVRVYRKATKPITAICRGPKASRKLLETMCLSLAVK